MAKAKKAPRKRKPEYAPPRPVLSVRVSERLFADISAEAAARKVSVTEVVYRRLLAHEALMGAGELEDLQRVVERDGMDLALEERGYKRISALGGTLWAEPNINVPQGSVLPLHPDLEAAIERAVERAVAAAVKNRKE